MTIEDIEEQEGRENMMEMKPHLSFQSLDHFPASCTY